MGIASYDYRVYYRYDENGSPIGFDLIKDGTTSTYTYEKNIQGDIVGILNDSTRRRVVTYVYDAWGKVTSVTGTDAETVGKYNSLRYRGYYYDTETGMYYLQSRYYDPGYKRFINADDPKLISELAKDSVLGGNLFAYCGNNAINDSDMSGKIGTRIVSAIAGGIIGGLLEITSQYFLYFVVHHNIKGFKFNWWALGVSVVTGVISGLVCMSRAKTMIQIITSVSVAILNNLVSFISSGKKLNKDVYINLFIDVTVAIITAATGGNGVAAKYFKAGKTVKGYYVYGRGKGITMKLKLTKSVLKDFAKAMWKCIWKSFVGIFAKAVAAV